MAISYGPYNGRARFGIDVSMSPSTVTKDTSSVTLTWKVYLQTDRTVTPGYSGNYTLSRTGTGPTGSGSVSVYTQGTTPQLLGTWTQAVSTSYSGTVSRSLTVEFTSALFDGSRPKHTVSFTVPKRPPQLPSVPTAASATRVSDTRIDVAWTRPSNASTDSTIWSNAVVQRRTGSGSWVTVATLAGTATSWADTSVVANGLYTYRVAGKNVTGTGSYRETSAVYTTPAAPTSVQAVKDSNGDIVVTWTDMSPYNDGWELRDNGVVIEANLPNSPASYTHVAPSTSTTHVYTVRARAGNPAIYSALSAPSNEVQLLSKPAPPTLLSPVSTTVAVGNVTFSWAHNPVDTTPQTRFELRVRPVGAQTWTVYALDSASQSMGIPMTVGAHEWQARTKGAHASLSDWSAVATFEVGTPPTATITAPSGTIPGPSTTLEWGFYHAEGNPQTGWQAEARIDGSVVASSSGTNAASSWKTPQVLPNGSEVTLRVRVRETRGLWSEWDELVILVDYEPPAESTVSAHWVDGQGHAYITARAVEETGKPATVTHNIERSTDGGQSWELIGEDLGTEVDFLDYEAPAGGSYLYRVTALSASPSAFATVVEVEVAPVPANNVVWISGGAGFRLALALAFNPEASVETGRTRSLAVFDGRTHPVEMSARQVPYALSVSASLPSRESDSAAILPGVYTATRAELEDLFALPGPHLYRDPDGRVIYGSVSALQWSRPTSGPGSVSFTITRVARPTAAQEAALARYYDQEAWIEL